MQPESKQTGIEQRAVAPGSRELPYRYNVELYRLDQEQPNSSELDYVSLSSGGGSGELELAGASQLEANLTSDKLEQPLFALNHLRSSTRYLARVRRLDLTLDNSFAELESGGSARSGSASSTLVGFSTSRADSAEQQSDLMMMTASLDPVLVDARSQLLSTLISTRSADSGQLSGILPLQPRNGSAATSAAASNHKQAAASREQQQLRSQQQRDGLLAGWWSAGSSAISSLFRVLQPNGGEQKASLSSGSLGRSQNQQLSQVAATAAAKQRQQLAANQRTTTTTTPLLDTSGLFLLTTICLLLFSSLALLMLLSRYLVPGCRSFGGKRRCAATNRRPKTAASDGGSSASSSSSSSSTASASAVGKLGSKVAGRDDNCSVRQSNGVGTATTKKRNSDGEAASLKGGFEGENIEPVGNQSNGYRSTTTTTMSHSIYDYYELASATTASEPNAGGACERQLSLSHRLSQPGNNRQLVAAAAAPGNSKTLGRRSAQPVVGAPAGQDQRHGFVADNSGVNALTYALPARVNKSRSSMCLGTMLMDSEREQQQQQRQQRLVELSDLNRCLIGHANLPPPPPNGQLVAAEQAYEQLAARQPTNWSQQCVQCDQPTVVGFDPSRATLTNDESNLSQPAYATGFVLCDVRQDYDQASPLTRTIQTMAGLNERHQQQQMQVQVPASNAACQKQQLLNFVVVQPDNNHFNNNYEMTLGSPTTSGGGQQSSASECEFQSRHLKSANDPMLPGHHHHSFAAANLGRQSASLISDESSELNGQCTWSLANQRHLAECYEQNEQMQYIELLPAVDFMADEPDAAKLVRELNHQACAGQVRQAGKLPGRDDCQVQQHQQQALCLSLASPSMGNSSSSAATNDIAVLSPSSLTNTTTNSQTDSILRSNPTLAKQQQQQQQQPLFDSYSTLKRIDHPKPNYEGGCQQTTNSPKSGSQLTSILKNSNLKQDQLNLNC